MTQHRIPMIGKKGFTSTAPWTPATGQARHLTLINPSGVREGFDLVVYAGSGDMVYMSESKTYAWLGRQLLKRQIVPFNKKNVPTISLKAVTEQFETAVRSVKQNIEGLAFRLNLDMGEPYQPTPPPTPSTLADVAEAMIKGLEEAAPAAAEAPTEKPSINEVHRDAVEQFKTLNAYSGEFNSLDRYQEIATYSAIYPGKGTPFGLMYAALGLAEAGEVQNKVKKAFRDDGVITFGHDEEYVRVKFGTLTPERIEQITKELGGALWYIAAVCNEIGASMSEVALANLEELAGRTERGTLSGSGDNR